MRMAREIDWPRALPPASLLAIARLRGAECRAPDGLAEAFHGRKIALQ